MLSGSDEFRVRLVQLAALYEEKLLQPERAIDLYLGNLGFLSRMKMLHSQH